MDLGSIRPLAQQIPRRASAGLTFVLPGCELSIGGETDAAWDVLALCDGRHTVEQIADALGGGSDDGRDDVRGLLAELLEHGALVDCTQAYRLLHRQGGAESAMFRALEPRQLQDLREESFEPPRTVGEPVALAPADTPLLELAARRRSASLGDPRAVGFGELCALLAATYGGDEARTVASAGALYPLIVHVAVRRPLTPLTPGIWWYDVAAARLRRTADGVPELEQVILAHELAHGLLAAGEPVIFISADLERPSRKYANRGYRYALMEAGAAMQNAYLVATELELPIRAIGGIHDRFAAELLDLDQRRAALLALLLGR